MTRDIVGVEISRVDLTQVRSRNDFARWLDDLARERQWYALLELEDAGVVIGSRAPGGVWELASTIDGTEADPAAILTDPSMRILDGRVFCETTQIVLVGEWGHLSAWRQEASDETRAWPVSPEGVSFLVSAPSDGEASRERLNELGMSVPATWTARQQLTGAVHLAPVDPQSSCGKAIWLDAMRHFAVDDDGVVSVALTRLRGYRVEEN